VSVILQLFNPRGQSPTVQRIVKCVDFRVGVVIPQEVHKQRKFPVTRFSLPFSSSVFDFQQES
jgi:hypothetical protein